MATLSLNCGFTTACFLLNQLETQDDLLFIRSLFCAEIWMLSNSGKQLGILKMYPITSEFTHFSKSCICDHFKKFLFVCIFLLQVLISVPYSTVGQLAGFYTSHVKLMFVLTSVLKWLLFSFLYTSWNTNNTILMHIFWPEAVACGSSE